MKKLESEVSERARADPTIAPCFYKFMTLLKYAKPESLKEDAKCLEQLTSDDTLGDAQVMSKVGHLFKRIENNGVDLPEEDPAWFKGINHLSWRKGSFKRRHPTTDEKLRRMGKRFRTSLKDAIRVNREIASFLLRYLLLIVYLENTHSDESTGVYVALSDVDTGIGTREHFRKKMKALGLEDSTIELCVTDFLGMDSRPYEMNMDKYEVTATNQPTGESAGVSTLTDSHAIGGSPARAG